MPCNLREFNSLTELRDFLNEIPEEKWIRWDRGNGRGACCAIGHVETAMCGKPHAYRMDGVSGDPGHEVFQKLIPNYNKSGFDTIATINNAAPDGRIKETVVAYLDSKITELEKQ